MSVVSHNRGDLYSSTPDTLLRPCRIIEVSSFQGLKYTTNLRSAICTQSKCLHVIEVSQFQGPDQSYEGSTKKYLSWLRIGYNGCICKATPHEATLVLHVLV